MTATLGVGAARAAAIAASIGDVITLGDDLTPNTSEWWLKRLLKALDQRTPSLQRYDRYYNGDQPLQFASLKYRAAFGDLFAENATNYCALVVDAVEERLNVEGFRIGTGLDDSADTDDDPDRDGDDDEGPEGVDLDAWRIWQANQLDAESQLAHVDALVKSVAYVAVSPFKDEWIDDQTPLICVEDALQVYVETSGSNRRHRRAAIKRWLDDSGYVYATLYLPDRIEKYQSAEKETSGRVSSSRTNQTWKRREVGILDADGNTTGEIEPWPLENPLGVVPILPLLNRPRITGDGRSEIDEVLPIQDAINKLSCDQLLAAEFAAFPQKYALNLVLEEDPDTGKPKMPFEIAVDKLLTVPPPEDGDPEVKFGQFDSADLKQYDSSIDSRIQRIASITRTPAHYLLGQAGTFPSGESLRAVETGLVAKVKRRQRFFGEVWEEAIRLAFQLLNDPRGAVVTSETIWRDPESRTESEHTDSLLKLASLNVPEEQLWADAGYTPIQIARFREMRAEQTTTPNLNVKAESVTGPPVAPTAGIVTPDQAAIAAGLSPTP